MGNAATRPVGKLKVPTLEEVLAYGFATWTLNEDAIKYVDLSLIKPWDSEILNIGLRNESATVDLTATLGSMRRCYSATATPRGIVACTVALATDLVTAVAHALRVGDAINFGATTGGFTVATTYYVLTAPSADTFTVGVARLGATFDITANGANTFRIAEEFFAKESFTVPKFAAATSTAPVAGLRTYPLVGWPIPPTKGRIYLAKSAVTAAAFGAYVEVRRGL